MLSSKIPQHNKDLLHISIVLPSMLALLTLHLPYTPSSSQASLPTPTHSPYIPAILARFPLPPAMAFSCFPHYDCSIPCYLPLSHR